MLGSTKFKIHINKTIAKILASLISYNEKINSATEPFTSTSNKDNIGIIDAIKYMEKILINAST